MKVQWKKNKRNKRMVLRVKNGEVLVSTPLRTSKSEVEHFINQSRDWIEKQLDKDQNCILENQKAIVLLGKTYTLVEDESCFILNDECHFNRNEKEWKKFLTNFGQDYLLSRFDYWSKIMDYSDLSLKFDFYSSKWGSCRKDRKEIRLSNYLAYCDLDSIDAVIVHELCHLKESNHSQRFYNEVLLWYPNYYQAHSKLKKITVFRTN